MRSGDIGRVFDIYNKIISKLKMVILRNKNSYNYSKKLCLEDVYTLHQLTPTQILNNEKNIERWITYDMIFKDIVDLEYEKHYKPDNQFSEENINMVLLSIINASLETKSTLGYHKSTIEHYLDEDIINLFT